MDYIVKYYKTFVVPIFSSSYYFFLTFLFSLILVILFFLGLNFDFLFNIVLTLWVCHLILGITHVVEDYAFDVILRIFFCSLLNLIFIKLLFLVFFF